MVLLLYQLVTNILINVFISGAVRKNPLTKEATNSEMNTAIMNWLRNASDRSGGRSKRNINKNKNVLDIGNM